MAAFTELDWRHIDVRAIVGSSGLAVVEPERQVACREWLVRNDYRLVTLDCGVGIGQAVAELGRMFDWEAQFGYQLKPENLSLDALNDGFEFEASESGCVLEITGADIAWAEEARWLLGLLSIAQDHSIRHLALGERFFTLLILAADSPLIGATVKEDKIPIPFWNAARSSHEF